MNDISKIIKEAVATFKAEGKCPTCNGIGYDLHVCPFCQSEGTVGVPLGISEGGIAQCKSCGKIIENIRKSTHQQCPSCHGTGKINESSIEDMKNSAQKIDNTDVDNNKKVDQPVEYPEGKQDTPVSYDADKNASKAGTGVFERLSPNQLNALLETLMRNKNSFNAMYESLANEGFVPLNEGATYEVKRTIISEMIKDGQFAKQMLQSLVENNQISVQNEAFTNFSGSKSLDDMNREYDKYGSGSIPRGANTAPEPMSMDGNEEMADDEEGGIIPTDQAANPEEENPEQMDANPELAGGSPDDEILDDIKGLGNVGQAKSELDTITSQMRQNSIKFGELARQAGYPDSQTFGQAISNPNNYATLTPEVRQVADFYKSLIAQQKSLQGKKNELRDQVAPPVQSPEFSQFEPTMEEAKNLQLGKGIGKSELQLRAGTKGKIFENRLRKLEPYKKAALLEFLENDPHMIDDQDYADMAVLTGICEGDLVSMRIEYEETINEMAYPVIGGQDVMGQNKKNESKQLNRDMKQASNSQETTEEKVRAMKNQKFDAKDTTDATERNGIQDQNRGMHTQIDVLNQTTNGTNKQKYEDQANGVYGKRDPKSVKTDANVGDGKVYGSDGTTNVGSELIDKGAKQPNYYEMSDNEGEKPVLDKTRPIASKEAANQAIPVRKVNEDLDRMKSLFGYNTNTYANAKPTNNHNVVFEEQLNNFRLMTESVDKSDRPNVSQLLAMPTVIFEGKETKFDGKNHFDKDGKKVDECDSMKESDDNDKDDKGFKSKFSKKEFGVEKLDEGTDTGKKCTECNHKIWEKDGEQKCMCKGKPTPEKEDILEAEKARMLKVAGVKPKVVNEISTGLVNRARIAATDQSNDQYNQKYPQGNAYGTNTPLGQKKGDQAAAFADYGHNNNANRGDWNDTKNPNPVKPEVAEAKNQQLKHAKGLQIKAGTQEELVDEAKNLQLKHTKGHQIEAGTVSGDGKKNVNESSFNRNRVYAEFYAENERGIEYAFRAEGIYYPEDKGIHTYSNGDPGYPGEPEYFEFDVMEVKNPKTGQWFNVDEDIAKRLGFSMTTLEKEAEEWIRDNADGGY